MLAPMVAVLSVDVPGKELCITSTKSPLRVVRQRAFVKFLPWRRPNITTFLWPGAGTLSLSPSLTAPAICRRLPSLAEHAADVAPLPLPLVLKGGPAGKADAFALSAAPTTPFAANT